LKNGYVHHAGAWCVEEGEVGLVQRGVSIRGIKEWMGAYVVEIVQPMMTLALVRKREMWDEWAGPGSKGRIAIDSSADATRRQVHKSDDMDKWDRLGR